MGKIVKYCSTCDEGFAERFAFCPVCSAALQAFEMNPVTGQSSPVEEPAPTAPAFIDETPVETQANFENVAETPAPAEIEEAPAVETAVPVEDVPAVDVAADHDVDLEYDDSKYDYLDVDDAPAPAYAAAAAPVPEDDGGYHITVIEEKNAAQRNGLLLGSTIFMIIFVGAAVVFSLFIKPLEVGAIGDGTELAYLGVDVPTDTEEVKPKKDKDDGGGGGGGKQEKDPASRGDLADQTPKPTRPPDPNTTRSDEPMLQAPSTLGNMKFPKVYNKWGLPNGLDGLTSSGTGSGGGIGSGTGTGQGSGSGTGAGSGTGSGYGGGNGNGNGNGTGDGTGAPPKAIVAVTTPLNILSKPRAQYTDEARQNQVQGTVVLKVTLLANGTIGSVVPVSRLGYGLTEKAIAAAREIRFEPKKVNGVPQSVTKTIEYNFNIY
jgi:protein TonB